MGIGFSFQLLERRMHIEQELIRLLDPAFTGAERRKHVRVPCRLHARLRTPNGPAPVTVTNLGCGGACLELTPVPAVHVEVELELLVGPGSGGQILSRFGQIAWSKGPRCGLAFEEGTEPLDQHILSFVLELLKRM